VSVGCGARRARAFVEALVVDVALHGEAHAPRGQRAHGAGARERQWRERRTEQSSGRRERQRGFPCASAVTGHASKRLQQHRAAAGVACACAAGARTRALSRAARGAARAARRRRRPAEGRAAPAAPAAAAAARPPRPPAACSWRRARARARARRRRWRGSSARPGEQRRLAGRAPPRCVRRRRACAPRRCARAAAARSPPARRPAATGSPGSLLRQPAARASRRLAAAARRRSAAIGVPRACKQRCAHTTGVDGRANKSR
jgi:hypothetical protein